MDDIMGRISELLTDEESVKQLSELAQMLVSDSEKNDGNDEKTERTVPEDQPDIASMLRLTGLIGEISKQDKNTDLLLALKPHLGTDKQKRVDKAIKLLKLLAIWNIAKESGLLHELI